MAKNATLVKKLTTKHIMGAESPADIKAMLGDKKSVELFIIYGTASGVKTGTSNYGEWTALLGRFRAVNKLTGEVVESGRAILPAIAQELILGKLGATADNQAVEFAFSVGLKADKTAAVGYQYTAEPLLAPSDADPMTKLETTIGVAHANIEAPKAEKAESGKKK